MSRFNYIPEYHCSLDKMNGGYIIHSEFDLSDDYTRNQSVDERMGKVKKLVFDEGYEPKYENWKSLHFPLVHGMTFGEVHSACEKFDELPEHILNMCTKAEKHLYTDVMFEKYVEGLGMDPSSLSIIDKLNLIENFKFMYTI